jgi:AcrR family transcriptional regulator
MTKKKIEVDLSTEEKIIDAARKVFTKKGYAATRTRDIAEEADINLALLNYYFRSKEKLFHIIMIERMEKFFGIIQPVISDENTTLEHKLERITDIYIDLLLANQDLSIFVLSEIRNASDSFLNISHHRQAFLDSVLLKQLAQRKPDTDPHHILLNLLGMIIFPFLSSALFKSSCDEQQDFEKLIMERKKLIPQWIQLML